MCFERFMSIMTGPAVCTKSTGLQAAVLYGRVCFRAAWVDGLSKAGLSRKFCVPASCMILPSICCKFVGSIAWCDGVLFDQLCPCVCGV